MLACLCLCTRVIYLLPSPVSLVTAPEVARRFILSDLHILHRPSDVTIQQVYVHHPTPRVRHRVIETRVLAAVRIKHTQTEVTSLSFGHRACLHHAERVVREVCHVVPLRPDPDDFSDKSSENGSLARNPVPSNYSSWMGSGPCSPVLL